MLRITADVNGRPVGYLYAHNKGPLDQKDPSVWVYDAAFYNPIEPLDSIFGIEGLLHHRTSGWMTLASLIMGVDAVRKANSYHTYK
jgi:hypothetical protein